LERGDGKKLKIQAHNVSSDQINQTFQHVREFFGDS